MAAQPPAARDSPAAAALEQATADFAEAMGLDVRVERDLLWIAEVGARSPLPPRWDEYLDEGSGRKYFCNRDDQSTTWVNPLVESLRDVLHAARTYLQDRSGVALADEVARLWQQLKDGLANWDGPFQDPAGNGVYFVDRTTNRSSWCDPRVDAQYVFELQSGLLSKLQQLYPCCDQDQLDRLQQEELEADEGEEMGVATLEEEGPPSGGMRVVDGERGKAQVFVLEENAATPDTEPEVGAPDPAQRPQTAKQRQMLSVRQLLFHRLTSIQASHNAERKLHFSQVERVVQDVWTVLDDDRESQLATIRRERTKLAVERAKKAGSANTVPVKIVPAIGCMGGGRSHSTDRRRSLGHSLHSLMMQSGSAATNEEGMPTGQGSLLKQPLTARRAEVVK